MLAAGPNHRTAAVVSLVLAAAALAPIWVCDFVPATDLPNHVAVSSVVARLLGGDVSAVSSYYELAVPTLPYHLAYALLVPAVGALGPIWGTRAVLTLLGVLTFLGSAAVLHALRRPWPAFLGGVFLFYSALFFWGFVATAVGLPVALLGLYCLIRHDETRRARYLVGACCAGALTGTAHVLLLPLWAALVVAYCSLHPRRNVAAAVLPLAASVLPLVPWLIGLGETNALSDTCLRLFYRSPDVLLYRAKRQFSVFGKGTGRAAHLGFVLFAALAALASRVAARKLGRVDTLVTAVSSAISRHLSRLPWGLDGRRAALGAQQGVPSVRDASEPPDPTPNEKRSDSRRDSGSADRASSPADRIGLVLIALGLLLFVLMPEEVGLGQDGAWGVNFRYFVLVELGVLALIPAPTHPVIRRGMSVAFVAMAGLFVVALWGTWRDFERVNAPLKPLLASLPPHQALTRVTVDPHFANAWPPLRAHLPAYYVASQGAFDHGLFAGGHVPLRSRVSMRAQTNPSWPLRLGDFDYMVVQGDVPPDHLPADGTLRAEAGEWKIYERRAEACWEPSPSHDTSGCTEGEWCGALLPPMCSPEIDGGMCTHATDELDLGPGGADGNSADTFANDEELLCLTPPPTHELHWAPQRPPSATATATSAAVPTTAEATQLADAGIPPRREPTFEVCF